MLLARKRMSGIELGRRAGMKQSTISRRLTGETAFDMDDLEKIADVLGVDVADLLPKPIRTERGSDDKYLYVSMGRTDDAQPSDHAVAPPFGPSRRRETTRPPSVRQGKRTRPANARPAVLPRPR